MGRRPPVSLHRMQVLTGCRRLRAVPTFSRAFGRALAASFHRLSGEQHDTGVSACTGASEIKLEEVVILNYTYTKLFDFISSWNMGVAEQCEAMFYLGI
ncbi:hypothetical protein BDA96_09G053900 [Sorghum bicolor]|uniref:Uncharacterized protein n=3 Tax=Sorghum bicolor TaxID=4558 RepID=A0A921Q7N3_SORBI|nr:hypothetical protein BDA96_09G053900 [Sorghum bicolor]KXG21350.1 hypothetical protein SORBI_3009G050800 [Sorghum bicolor]